MQSLRANTTHRVAAEISHFSRPEGRRTWHACVCDGAGPSRWWGLGYGNVDLPIYRKHQSNVNIIDTLFINMPHARKHVRESRSRRTHTPSTENRPRRLLLLLLLTVTATATLMSVSLSLSLSIINIYIIPQLIAHGARATHTNTRVFTNDQRS